MIYKMEISDSVDDMIFPLLEVPIADKDITGIADNTTIDGNVYRDYLWLKKQWTQKWSIMCQDEYNRLRGFWTRQFGNAEVPFYRLFYGDNVYEDRNTFTVNGFVQIENDAPLYSPLSLTQLTGNATQETLSGKNLWGGQDFNGNPNISATVKYKADGTVSITGTNDVLNWTLLTSSAYQDNHMLELPAGTYAFYVDGSTYDTQLVSTKTDGTGERADITINGGVGAGTFTLTETRLLYPRCRVPAGTTNKIVRFMIISGVASQIGDYEPYTGSTPTQLVPSPNPSYPQPVEVVSGGQFVKVTKKNLLPTAGDWTQNVNGLVVSCTDGVYRLLGKATSGSTTSIYRLKEPYIVQVGDYLHLGNPTTDSHSNVQFFFDDGDNDTIVGSPYGQTNKIVSLDQYAGRTLSRVRCNFNANYDLDVELKPMILHNISTQTDYEPYESQMQTINLGGVNLFNVNDIEGGTTQNMTVDSDGWLTCTIDNTSGTSPQYGLWLTNNLTALKTSTYYAIVMEVKNVSGSGSIYPTQGSGANCQFTSNIGVNFSSISSGNTYVYTQITKADFSNTYQGLRTVVTFSAGQSGSITFRLSVITDTTMTPRRFWYLPYTTYAYELAKIGTYQDYIWNDNGTWYIRRAIGKVVLDGTENWGTDSSGGVTNYKIMLSDALGGDTLVTCVCDYFMAVKGSIAWSGSQPNVIGIGTSKNLRIRNSPFTTLSAFTTWLGTHNTTVYYALATPTDTEITDSDLIEQLNFVASLYEGVNNIMLIPSAGEQGEIGVKYRLNYEQETDIVPKTPVVLTLSDGGVINTCGCRENIQLIMRETTQGNSES